MPEHEPVPENMKTDGVPYWELLGGSAVTLVGDSIDPFGEYFISSLETEGHRVTGRINQACILSREVERMYEGELGIVVVFGTFKERQLWGPDMALYVPAMLKEIDEHPPLIFSDLYSRCMDQPNYEKLLLERGYAAVVKNDGRMGRTPDNIFPDTARLVTQLAAQVVPS